MVAAELVLAAGANRRLGQARMIPPMNVGLDLAACTATHAGVGRYVEELARALLAQTSPEDHLDKLVLFAGDQPPAWLVQKLHPSVDLRGSLNVRVETRCADQVHPAVRANLFLGPWLARVGIRVFHSPDTLGFPLTCQRSVARVVTIHDLIPQLFPQSVTRGHRLIRCAMLPLVVKRADRLIAVSQATARDLLEMFPNAASKVRVVYSGVDSRFAPAPLHEVAALRRRLGLPSEYVLYLGTLSPRKNLDGLFEAYELLHQRKADVPPLVVAGKPGWLWEPIMRRADALGLRTRVIFCGFVPDEGLPALLTGATLFALPSLYEGFGLPVLEAMACGTPVVTSDRSSLPEVAGDAAHLVDPKSPEAIADGIRRVLHDDPYRAELRRRGFDRAHAFRWELTARQTVAVYREALAQH